MSGSRATQEKKSDNAIMEDMTPEAFVKPAQTVAAGAVGTWDGFVARAVTWPLEKTYTITSQKENKETAWRIFTHLMRYKKMQALEDFLSAGAKQTFYKSFSSMGSTALVKHLYPDASPLRIGLYSGMVGFGLESYLTWHPEYRRVQMFLKSEGIPIREIDILHPSFRQEKRTVIAVTTARLFVTANITFCAIYPGKKFFEEHCPDYFPKSVASAIGAGVSAASVQLLNMPWINAQNLCNRFPNKSLMDFYKSYRQETGFKGMFKGVKPRMVNRGVFYGTAYICDEAGNYLIKQLSLPTSVPRLVSKPIYGNHSVLTLFSDAKRKLLQPVASDSYRRTLGASCK